jgi:hypothetical protein
LRAGSCPSKVIKAPFKNKYANNSNNDSFRFNVMASSKQSQSQANAEGK